MAAAFETEPRRRPVAVTDEAGGGRSWILVVEPDERTRSVIEVGLAREGLEVVAIGSAEEAMWLLGPDRPLPAMIFSEADLRGSDGFSFCAQIRADQRTADLPVVLLSRTAEAWHRELAGGSGADQYLPKPLFLMDLVALARLMSGRSSWAARFPAETGRLPIAQALRALLSGVRSGRLELEDGSGWLSFRDGCVIDATFENARGGEGLRRLLLLGRGSYIVSFGPALSRAHMTFGLEDLCGRTYQQVQRWNRLLETAVPLDSVRVVDFARIAVELERLPDQVNEIIRLSDGRRTVRDVIIECSLDEVTALEAVMRLEGLGVLVPPSAPPEVEASRILVPSFFAPDLPIIDALPPELQRQLDAFRIQPVVEAPEARTSSAEQTQELAAFTDAGELQTAPGLQTAASDATAELEAQFFEPESAPARAPASSWSSLLILGGAVLLSASAVTGAFLWKHSSRAVARVAPSPMEAAPAEMDLAEGIALYDAGDLRQAAALLDGFTRREPNSAQAWVYLGLARFDLGDAAGAEAAAMRALELEPKNGRAMILLASVHLAAGQQLKANVELRRYLELEPKGAYAAEARQLLRH